jgi:hypothetical protein
MNVSKWGPGTWVFLHTVVSNYPLDPKEEDKDRIKNFFKNIQINLPCKYCRDSFKVYAKYLPIESFYDSREGLTYWLFKIHNLVNDKIFAKYEDNDFFKIIKKYEGFRAKCGKMVRDDNLDKKYSSCKLKTKTVSDEFLKNYVEKTIKKYEPIANKYIKTLMNSDDNPNKEQLKYDENKLKGLILNGGGILKKKYYIKYKKKN